MDVAFEINVLPFDRVCRTCLCISEDLMDSQLTLVDVEPLSLEQMMNQTFGKIVSFERKRKQNFHYWMVSDCSFE